MRRISCGTGEYWTNLCGNRWGRRRTSAGVCDRDEFLSACSCLLSTYLHTVSCRDTKFSRMTFVLGIYAGQPFPPMGAGFLLQIADSSPVISKFDHTLIIVYCRLETIELPSVCTLVTSSPVKKQQRRYYCYCYCYFRFNQPLFSNTPGPAQSPDENLCRLLELHAPTRWRPIPSVPNEHIF